VFRGMLPSGRFRFKIFGATAPVLDLNQACRVDHGFRIACVWNPHGPNVSPM